MQCSRDGWKRQTVLEYLQERRVCVQRYTYLIVSVDDGDDEQCERIRRITRNEPLKIGRLYTHLGRGFEGAYRVLALLEVKEKA